MTLWYKRIIVLQDVIEFKRHYLGEQTEYIYQSITYLTSI